MQPKHTLTSLNDSAVTPTSPLAHPRVLLDDAGDVAAALLDVALDAPREAHVVVGVDVDLSMMMNVVMLMLMLMLMLMGDVVV